MISLYYNKDFDFQIFTYSYKTYSNYTRVPTSLFCFDID